MIVNNKGKLDYCPFRIVKSKEYNPEVDDYEVVEYFADCMKEDCICYRQNAGKENGKIIWIVEECSTDQLCNHIDWNEEDMTGR